MNNRLDDLGSFADASIQILVALSDGPRHGYAIMTEIERETGRPIRPGTLYAALARLERRGLIEAMPAADRRHPYRLTSLGKRTLAFELAQLQSLARRGMERLERTDG